MQWTDDKTLLLIEKYRTHRCLWDPSNPQYKHSSRKLDAWTNISDALGVEQSEIKKKINSLLASFRRERSKEGKIVSAGMGVNEVYHSKWFAFKSMSFLLDKFNARKSIYMEVSVDEIKKEGKSDISDYEESSFAYLHDEEEQGIAFEEIEDNDASITAEVPDTPEASTTEDTILGLEIPQSPATARELPSQENQQLSRKRLKMDKLDQHVSGALNIIRTVSDIISKREGRSHMTANYAFADYVASKLEGYDCHVQNIVQHKINEVLFQADMGNFNRRAQRPQLVSPPPQSPTPAETPETVPAPEEQQN